MTDATVKKLSIDVAYSFGDVVFLRLRSDRVSGMVTRLNVTNNGVTYGVTWGVDARESWHFDYELTGEYLPSYEGN